MKIKLKVPNLSSTAQDKAPFVSKFENDSNNLKVCLHF